MLEKLNCDLRGVLKERVLEISKAVLSKAVLSRAVLSRALLSRALRPREYSMIISSKLK